MTLKKYAVHFRMPHQTDWKLLNPFVYGRSKKEALVKVAKQMGVKMLRMEVKITQVTWENEHLFKQKKWGQWSGCNTDAKTGAFTSP